MIDRSDRSATLKAIERFANEEIGAFEFDETLQAIAAETKDSTVVTAAHLLWFTYDDVTDHKIVADKQAWDFIQRIAMILTSDAELEENKLAKWSFRQPIALTCLVAFAALTWKTGWGAHLCIWAIPFGVPSMLLSHWRNRTSPTITWDPKLFPFETFSQLSHIRRHSRGFQKLKYPIILKGRRIRGKLIERALHLQRVVAWLMFSPLVLLAQSFPETTNQIKIRAPT